MLPQNCASLSCNFFFLFCGLAFDEEAGNHSFQSIRPKEHMQGKISESITEEETKEPGVKNLDRQLTNFTTSYIPERKETDGEGMFSTKKKGSVSFSCRCKFCYLCCVNFLSSLVHDCNLCFNCFPLDLWL